MILLLEFTFLVCIFLLLHSYVLYPAHLYILYRLKWKKKIKIVNAEIDTPFISCIISVYNEERIIEQKIRTVLESDYPKDKIKLFIGSDASSDQSNIILKKLCQEDSRIQFYDFKIRRGKTNVINDLIDEAFKVNAKSTEHILLFTDANVLLSKKVIYDLSRHFADDKLALVDSKIIPTKARSEGISSSENQYMNMEIFLKYLEGEIWGAMMGAFGGCFALRSVYFEKVPKGFLVDDFFISMTALSKGGHCKNDLNAICFEGKPDKIMEEFKRKARISAGNFQNLFYFYKRLFKKPLTVAYAFLSHKVLRWTGPLIFIIAWLIGLMLSLMIPFTYLALFLVINILLVTLPLLDVLFSRLGFHFALLRGIRYFIVMNIALLFGFIKYLKGIKKSSWEPPERNIY